MLHFSGIPPEKSLEDLCSENKCLALPENCIFFNIFQVVHEERELLKNHKAEVFLSDFKWSDKTYCHAETQLFKDLEHFFSFSETEIK